MYSVLYSVYFFRFLSSAEPLEQENHTLWYILVLVCRLCIREGERSPPHTHTQLIDILKRSAIPIIFSQNFSQIFSYILLIQRIFYFWTFLFSFRSVVNIFKSFFRFNIKKIQFISFILEEICWISKKNVQYRSIFIPKKTFF